MATAKLIPTPSMYSTSTSSIDWYNTPATSAPQGYTSNLVSPPSISYKITICNSICAVVIITCVALRIASRMFIVKKLGSDDYVNVIALVFWIATMGMFQYLTHVGMGKHLWDVRATVYTPDFLRAWAIAAMMYSGCMMFIKVSILLLYRRVFPVGTFMIRWWFVLLFTVGYSLGGICASLFSCTPVESAWDLWITADHCIDTAAFYIANGVLNCVSDLFILALPLPIIWSLSLARRQKAHLFMLFGVGIVSCIVSIVRLESIITFLNHGDSDITYDIVAINIWSQAELTVAFICACSPALRPFMIWLFGPFFRENSSASDPCKGPYHKTPRAISPGTRNMFDIEMGAPSKNKTVVSASRAEWDNESTQRIVRRGSNRDRQEVIEESDEDTQVIVVETTYRIHSGLQSPLPYLLD